MSHPHIIAVDQSTSASKVFLLDENGAIVRRFAKPHRQFYPQPGFVEHDAEEIWQNVREGIIQVSEGIQEIAAIAISNQRETTVLWDRETEEPLCKAVVWQDVRGERLCNELRQHGEQIRQWTGLPLSPYFPAAKAASVLRADPLIKAKAEKGDLCIGTVDSYLVYRLTHGKVFQTDVSNASRTQMMNLKMCAWSAEICGLFGIPDQCLPKIVPSDASFGETNAFGIPDGIPITGVMGDSHAALFGQRCHHAGMAKATYGTGSSVMMNIGSTFALSSQGLATSIGYGFQGEICYVLEGNVTCSGDTLRWLRDEAGLIADIKEAEKLSNSIEDTQGVYLVPAFSGLGAPHNDSGARALLYGMNRGSTKAHIVRAALESMAYQDADIIHAMQKDTGRIVDELRVDGEPTKNRFLMQFQADLLNCPVQSASQSELSAIGVGYMAGITTGVYPDWQSIQCAPGARYEPQMNPEKRERCLNGWADAILRCRR